MLTFTSEFFFGVFIGFVLGLLINGMVFNSQLHDMGILITNMKSRKSLIMKSLANKIYSPDIETLWNDLDNYTIKEPSWTLNFHLTKWHSKFINYLKKTKFLSSKNNPAE